MATASSCRAIFMSLPLIWNHANTRELNESQTSSVASSTPMRFRFENAYFLIHFRLSSALKRPKTPMKTGTFQNGFKRRDFWEHSVCSMNRWKRRFSVQIGASIQDGGWLTHAYVIPGTSHFHRLVWIGENDTKTLARMKIFCFVFAAMKTDTFENALLWMGPESSKMLTRQLIWSQKWLSLLVNLVLSLLVGETWKRA